MMVLSFFSTPQKKVFVIQEKEHVKKYSGSFRSYEEEACKVIYEFVNEKIKLTSDANQYETIVQRNNIIEIEKERNQALYRDLYKRTVFSKQWMDNVVFEDNTSIKKYEVVAQMRAN